MIEERQAFIIFKHYAKEAIDLNPDLFAVAIPWIEREVSSEIRKKVYFPFGKDFNDALSFMGGWNDQTKDLWYRCEKEVEMRNRR